MYRARTHVNQKACICMYEDTMHMQYHDIIVFDTETSGVKPSKDYIVQLSARKFKNEGGELILKDKRNIYIRPPSQMNFFRISKQKKMLFQRFKSFLEKMHF